MNNAPKPNSAPTKAQFTAALLLERPVKLSFGQLQAELAMSLRPVDAGRNPVPETYTKLVPAYVLRGSGEAAVAGAKLTFHSLIPGTVYVLRVNMGRGWVNLKEFTVKPGQELNLGNVTFQPPPADKRE